MTEKKKRCDKNISVEELYQNKNFVPPKEKNLETIFEEPRKTKDGAPILTSVRKYKRYLHFDPTEGKIHKRKLKAKKCLGRMKAGKRLRSSPKASKKKCKDISMYILDAIDESSESDMDHTNATDDCRVGSLEQKSESKTPEEQGTKEFGMGETKGRTLKGTEVETLEGTKVETLEEAKEGTLEETGSVESARSSCTVT